MPKLNSTIPVAYLNIRGAAILAAFFDSTFERLSSAERAETYASLRASASGQGFQGDVVALWEDSLGRTRFIAPPQQHPFFQVVNYGQLRAQANGTLQV